MFMLVCRPIALAIVLITLLAAPAARRAPHQDRCVVLLSIDGLANFYLDDPKADMPTMRRLAREGRGAGG